MGGKLTLTVSPLRPRNAPVSCCQSAGCFKSDNSRAFGRRSAAPHLLNGYNTYLAAPRSPDLIVDHPRGELFRPNGTYHRSLGRTGLEGWYAIEGDWLCVAGDGIPKQCRKLIPQGGNSYLLVDVVDGSKAVLELSQVK